MKAVLYTHDLEPITVIDLWPEAWKRLARGGTWNIPVFMPLKCFSAMPSDPVRLDPIPIVTITAERIVKGEHETLLLFTHQEEAALMVKAAFLPGQSNSMRDFNCDAFREGFLAALRKFS